MRVGLVGTGRIGAEHARVVAAHPLVDEVVLADADHARAAAVAAPLGAKVAESVDALLGDVDAVVITAATAAHPDLIVRAAHAGLPAFCEKPVATDLAGSVRVLDEVARTGAVVQIGFQRRFDAGYVAARAAVQGGEIGELRRAHVLTADPAPPSAEYVPTSGGLWRDCTVHDIDALRFVTGREVVEVYALGSNRGADYFALSDDVDEAVALLTMDDGTLVTVQGSRYNGGGYDVRMELAGTAGTVVVGLDDRAPLRSAEPGVTFPDGRSWPGFWPRFLPAYRAEIEAFVELAAGRRDNPCSVAEALEAFYVAEAATRSRAEHRAVRVDEVRPR